MQLQGQTVAMADDEEVAAPVAEVEEDGRLGVRQEQHDYCGRICFNNFFDSAGFCHISFGNDCPLSALIFEKGM